MRIERGEVNQVPVTLTELTTLTSPYYLFEFLNDTNIPKYVIVNSADDLSDADQQERCNVFEIEEVASGANPVNGTITLVDGDYRYTVYEQSSSTNIVPTNATGIVEKGICTVYTVAASEDKVYVAGLTNKVYNG